MNTLGVGTISIFLLSVGWRWWLGRDEADKDVIRQGILLAGLTVAWFLRIVFAE